MTTSPARGDYDWRKSNPFAARVTNQAIGADPFYRWKGMKFRSKNEILIAQALADIEGTLFFPNCAGFFVEASGQLTRIEPDFLIFSLGRCGRLEVDSATYHEDATKDHKSDRLLGLAGIPTYRYSFEECCKQPGGVVDQFVKILKVSD